MTSQALIYYCVTLQLLILIENIVLVVSQENVLFAIVSIELKARKRVFEVPMTS